jgi:hypothetical protein
MIKLLQSRQNIIHVHNRFPIYFVNLLKNANTERMSQIAILFLDVNLRWLLIAEGDMFIDNQNGENLILKNSRLKDELLDSKNKIIELLEKSK